MTPLLGKPLAKRDEESVARMREAIGTINLCCIYDPASADAVSYLHQLQATGRMLQTAVEPIACSSLAEAWKIKQRLTHPNPLDSFVVLRPLPFADSELISLLPAERDPDCLGAAARSAIYSGDKNLLLPGTARSVMELVAATGVAIRGRRALVIGRSLSVGLPIFNALMRADAFVSLAHSKVSPAQIAAAAREADIIVLASGKRGLVPPESIRAGQIIIDCGYHASDRGGDLGFVPPEDLPGFYTPVPGGVGPLTAVSLFYNAYSELSRSLTDGR